MPPEISVENGLFLRYLTPDDAESLLPIIQEDPEIKRNVTWPAGVDDIDDARQSINQLLEGNKSPYVLQKNGETIGFVGLWGAEGNNHEVGFSYFLAKNCRGHGYVTNAVQKLMHVAKQKLPIDTFVVNITDSNISSQSLAKKLGFEATDILTKDEALPELIRRYERPA